MLNIMKQQEWPDDRVNIVKDFRVALETHNQHWHDSSEYHKQALPLYQARICRDWYNTLGTADAFRLLPLHLGCLIEHHQGIETLDNAYAAKISAIPMVRFSLFPT